MIHLASHGDYCKLYFDLDKVGTTFVLKEKWVLFVISVNYAFLVHYFYWSVKYINEYL